MEPEGGRPLDPALRDIESIQNIDTARLALRWALERVSALERRAVDGEESLRRAEAAAARAGVELTAARDLLSRRTAESLERERYYAKLEEYLNLKLAGSLDAAALARREAGVARLEAELQGREIALERRAKSEKDKHDEELRRAASEADAAADARVRQMRDELSERLSAREREHSSRLLSLHEKQAQLSSLERSLEERSKRLEELFAAQRAALEQESSTIAQASRDQAEFLERRLESALAAKSQALESAWQVERRALLDELAEWRAKAREHLPDLLSAQSRAESGEERAARAEIENRSLRRLAEERLGELMAHEASEEGRREELARLEAVLAVKLRDAELSLFRQYDAWLVREEELRHRDVSWLRDAQTRRESAEAARREIVILRDELKRTIAEYREKTKGDAGPGPREGETR